VASRSEIDKASKPLLSGAELRVRIHSPPALRRGVCELSVLSSCARSSGFGGVGPCVAERLETRFAIGNITRLWLVNASHRLYYASANLLMRSCVEAM
jgi:hypothetical protein